MRTRNLFTNGEGVLLVGLVAEITLFSVLLPGTFPTLVNAFEVLRFSVELGLLALALTPILISGGIDLSVGSAVGLCAVIFGLSVKTAHLPLAAAVLVTVVLGCICGVLNAMLITRLGLPALIVTLGTYSLYRGLGEGLTRGAVSYSEFSLGFLFLGQGYLWRVMPAQLPIFLLAILFCGVMVHRSIMGRALYAIGLNKEGARYAGIPTQRYEAVLYVFSGFLAGIAAIILVAHLGLAKADLGTGYELSAITAVVLGGTSVFGGRGTVHGTVLGLFFLSVLQNGIHLLALPSELSGVLSGVLLLAIVSVDQIRRSNLPFSLSAESKPLYSAFVRRTATAATTAVCFSALLIWALRHRGMVGHSTDHATTGHRPVIAVMPKAKGDPYFISARSGAEEAARELGVDLIWDGPTSLDASQQNELVENWITMGVDAIVVAVENKGSISTVLRKAREHGIPVLTWDSDAEPDARDFFLNQATPKSIGDTLTDEAARLLAQKGQFAIITGALTAENQNEWISFIRARVAEKYPGMSIVTVRPSDDDRDKAFAQTQTILKVYPRTRLVMDISAPAVPGSAEAVQQSGRTDVDVVGLSLPTICRSYIHSGSVQAIILWNTHDLGYLTVYAGWLEAEKKISRKANSIRAGRLGVLNVQGTQIILGSPLVINRSNIDRLDF
jgi:ribose/xylose/arabinose/galactoside ABC-type transport system permease subunit/ABC-type sugar transport system substrate-binding protein